MSDHKIALAADELKELGDDLPDVLLDYQKRLLTAIEENPVVICEKSRRIGMTWAVASLAVLTAASARSAGGMDVIYIGYNRDMAREFIDTCAMWAKAFMSASMEINESVFKDQYRNPDGRMIENDIQAFRINFASGFEIMALSSRPRSLRGKQGLFINDESAFHDALDQMIKAAMAFLIWGGKVLFISTHDGDTNPFNQLVQDARSGKVDYKVVRVTFDDAVRDGLYERVKLIMEARGQSVKGKEAWIQDIYDFYRDDADEELRVIPSQGSGTVLSTPLLESRMRRDIPVFRLERKPSWQEVDKAVRKGEVDDWIADHLDPILENLPQMQSHFGMDYGRVSDLSVIWPAQRQLDMSLLPPFVVEMACIPKAQQQQVLWHIIRKLPRFSGGAIDAGGNGAGTAEDAAEEFGLNHIAQVKFSERWYIDHMPRFISAFDEDWTRMPADANILADHRLLRRVKGVIKVPDLRNIDLNNRDKKRHGDSAIAHALCVFATTLDVAEIDFASLGVLRPSLIGPDGGEEDGVADRIDLDTGFGVVRGSMNWRGF